jgi:transposase
VKEIVVLHVGKKAKRHKSDRIDAFGLAEKLRIGDIKTRVYKSVGEFKLLSELSRAYIAVMRDSVRVQNRIKFLFRSRAISTGCRDVYAAAQRSFWLKKLPADARFRAEILYQELDSVNAVRREAEKEMIKEAKRHRAFRVLTTCPGMGPRRVAQLLPIVITPYRFSNKRAFWAYIGLAVVMRSSSDWVRTADGRWVRANVELTRGLNNNYNRALKQIFKGAATTVIQQRDDDPLYHHYCSLLDNGTKPNLAKLTIARQIASIVLSMWRSGEEYDKKKLKKEK